VQLKPSSNMASIESRLFNLLLGLINKKKFLELQFAFGRFDFYNCNEPSKETHKNCDVVKSTVNGHNVFTLTPKTERSKSHILYFHGGAYVQGFVKQHWKFLSMLVQQTGCSISAPDYPLAPKFTFVDAFEMITPVYKEIIAESGAVNTILMGDSAGGGFALAFAQKMKSDNVPTPGKIILLSPWLDITLTNPEIQKIDLSDPFLSVKALRKAGLSFAGSTDPSDFRLSPINGPLSGVGEISIFIGSRDILVADARKLNSCAKEEGIPLNYNEYKEMVHVWMLLNFRESKQAKRQIVDLIRN
jgi:acetyl esterase/lipase